MSVYAVLSTQLDAALMFMCNTNELTWPLFSPIAIPLRCLTAMVLSSMLVMAHELRSSDSVWEVARAVRA